MKLRILSLISMPLLLFSCTGDQITDKLDKGVSAKLAKYRAAEFSALHYALSFDIPSALEQRITAHLDLNFHSQRNTAFILDFAPDLLQIDACSVNGKSLDPKVENGHIVISARDIKGGQNTISMDFTAGELSLNRQKDLLYTLFVPSRAHTVFPCLDQPDIKAHFDLELSLPKDWSALSAAAIRSVVMEDSVQHIQFERSEQLSTYLFSFVAGNFHKEKVGSIAVLLRDQDKWTESAVPVGQLHQEAIDFLEDYTALDLPFDKLDIALLPGFQYGGMEHVGAIQYRENLILLDARSSEVQRISRAKLIAHETAHMWFGNWVTMTWFNDVWMKEVFANFMADKIVNPMYPQLDHDLQFLLTHYPAAYSVDRTTGANPIRQDLDNLNDAGSMYGNIIYHKAPVVLRQLEAIVGQKAFRTAVQDYLRTFGNGNADWNQLIALLDSRSKRDIAQWSKDWITTPGRPLIRFELETEGDSLHWLNIWQKAEDGSDRTWTQEFTVDLVYPTHVDRRKIVMDAKAIRIPIKGQPKPDFIQLNSTATGYGRFEVDARLLKQLDRIDADLARAEAYVDVFENCLADMMSEEQTLEVLMYGLHRETDPLLLQWLGTATHDLFWYKMDMKDRESHWRPLTDQLWADLLTSLGDRGKSLFKLYVQLAYKPSGIANIQAVWSGQNKGIAALLNENDRTDLGLQLALFDSGNASRYLQDLRESYKNQDLIDRLDFLNDALSNDPIIRKEKMRSLAQIEQRAKEPWVNTCLHYLHHPLRQHKAIKELPLCLELLEEIQKTGDIFFPKSWLDNSIGQYRSEEAKQILQDYLEAHTDLDHLLRAKVLQSTYHLTD